MIFSGQNRLKNNCLQKLYRRFFANKLLPKRHTSNMSNIPLLFFHCFEMAASSNTDVSLCVLSECKHLLRSKI